MRYLRGGALVTLEGIDGTGKTTQVRRLADRYALHSYPVSTFREPGASEAGQKLREAARHGRLDPEQENALFLEDRRHDVDANIRPALEEGRLVLLDRYYLSNMAYQGARGVDPERILGENEVFAPRPDITVVLDLPVDQAFERMRARGRGQDRFETMDSLRAVRDLFLRFARTYPWVRVVDASRSLDQVARAVVEVVDPVIAAKE